MWDNAVGDPAVAALARDVRAAVPQYLHSFRCTTYRLSLLCTCPFHEAAICNKDTSSKQRHLGSQRAAQQRSALSACSSSRSSSKEAGSHRSLLPVISCYLSAQSPADTSVANMLSKQLFLEKLNSPGRLPSLSSPLPSRGSSLSRARSLSAHLQPIASDTTIAIAVALFIW